MNDITNLNEKLSRIKDATDSIRNTLGMTTSDVIENVASGVSTLNIEKQELEEELEHAEERVLNEYFNINLDNTTNWTQMQKQAIPYTVNGLSSLEYYFHQYPFEEINISGTFGKPQSLFYTFANCQANVVNIPTIDTSNVINFSGCFQNYGDGTAYTINSSVLQSIIDNWDTSKGRDFNSMFGGIWSVQGTLNLSHFNMGQAENIGGMLSSNSLTITGFEHWNISNNNYFDSLFSNCSSKLSWKLDLTEWHNNKNGDWLECYGMFGWNYSRPQKILIPNIKNDYRNYTQVGDMFSYDYHLLLADISGLDLTKNVEGLYSMFNTVSPWCAIIVKDSNSKQELLNYYPDFKQVYTKAEYEANDDLYTTFNIYLTDREGNDLADTGAKFVIQYQDNEDWYDCWSNNGNQLYYPEEGYSVVLPREYKYRFKAVYINNWSEQYEIDADQTQIDVIMECGPQPATCSFDIYNNNTGEIMSGPIDITIRQPNDDTDVITYEGETITLTGYEGQYVNLRFGGGLYDYYSTDIYFNNQHEEYYMSYKQIHLEGTIYWQNGEVSNSENKYLRYYWVDYNTGEDIGSGSSWDTTGGIINWGTNMSVQDLIEHTYKLGIECTYENTQYANYIFDENDMDDNGIINIPNIILPTPVYATVTVHAIDTSTNQLLDIEKITNLGIIQDGNWTTSASGINELEGLCKVGSNACGYVETTSDYVLSGTPVITVQEGMNDVNVYASPAITFDLHVYNENGEDLPSGEDIIYRLYSYNANYELITSLEDVWASTPMRTTKRSVNELNGVAYIRAYATGYRDMWDDNWSDFIPYDPSITSYTISIAVITEQSSTTDTRVHIWYDGNAAYAYDADFEAGYLSITDTNGNDVERWEDENGAYCVLNDGKTYSIGYNYPGNQTDYHWFDFVGGNSNQIYIYPANELDVEKDGDYQELHMRIYNTGTANLTDYTQLYYNAININTGEEVNIQSTGTDAAGYYIFVVPRCANGYSRPRIDHAEYGTVCGVEGMNANDINGDHNAVYQSKVVNIDDEPAEVWIDITDDVSVQTDGDLSNFTLDSYDIQFEETNGDISVNFAVSNNSENNGMNIHFEVTWEDDSISGYEDWVDANTSTTLSFSDNNMSYRPVTINITVTEEEPEPGPWPIDIIVPNTLTIQYQDCEYAPDCYVLNLSLEDISQEDNYYYIEFYDNSGMPLPVLTGSQFFYKNLQDTEDFYFEIDGSGDEGLARAEVYLVEQKAKEISETINYPGIEITNGSVMNYGQFTANDGDNYTIIDLGLHNINNSDSYGIATFVTTEEGNDYYLPGNTELSGAYAVNAGETVYIYEVINIGTDHMNGFVVDYSA